MRTYLVGGAVRDALLGQPVSERDYVVVGADADAMRAAGFRPVGKDFPVFIHPETGEEYALARTERKSGRGYHGFEMYAHPSVTLEEDLLRRDLTINAMALDDAGRMIDPYGGRRDLDARLLRHVSPAFAEDPVRILRIARFHARLAPLGFRVADETLALMQQMVEHGEVDHLVPERVWKELERALMAPRPERFFLTLRECGALRALLPELDALFGVPQSPTYHPEIDSGVHTLLALAEAARSGTSAAVRFAVLLHDLGKGITPEEQWPRHIAHEAASARLAQQVCERLKTPREFRDLAVLVARHHLDCHRALALRPSTLLKLLEAADALRRPQRLEDFLLACRCDARGRTGREHLPYPQADRLRLALSLAGGIDVQALLKPGLTGDKLRNTIRCARSRAIRRGLANEEHP